MSGALDAADRTNRSGPHLLGRLISSFVTRSTDRRMIVRFGTLAIVAIGLFVACWSVAYLLLPTGLLRRRTGGAVLAGGAAGCQQLHRRVPPPPRRRIWLWRPLRDRDPGTVLRTRRGVPLGYSSALVIVGVAAVVTGTNSFSIQVGSSAKISRLIVRAVGEPGPVPSCCTAYVLAATATYGLGRWQMEGRWAALDRCPARISGTAVAPATPRHCRRGDDPRLHRCLGGESDRRATSGRIDPLPGVVVGVGNHPRRCRTSHGYVTTVITPATTPTTPLVSQDPATRPITTTTRQVPTMTAATKPARAGGNGWARPVGGSLSDDRGGGGDSSAPHAEMHHWGHDERRGGRAPATSTRGGRDGAIDDAACKLREAEIVVTTRILAVG